MTATGRNNECWRALARSGRLLLLLAFCLFPGAPAFAQGGTQISQEDLEAVMPDATRFSEREGDPPVIRAYFQNPFTGEEELLGYAFLTSDLPPEVMGYDAPIEVLVGMDLEGTLTGARIVAYRESLYETRGHFFGAPGFQEQFAGKHITDPFRLRTDVDNISGATISVDAMARGVRNAARRVAALYLTGEEPANAAEGGTLDLEELETLSWPDLTFRGPVERLAIVEDGVVRLEVFVSSLWEPGVGEMLLGTGTFAEILEEAGERAEEKHLFFLGVDGNTVWFRPYMLAFIQNGDTLAFESQDLLLRDNPSEGKVADQLQAAGVWLVDERVDPTRPYTVEFGGGLGLEVTSVDLPGRPRPTEAAEVADAGVAAEEEEPEGAGEPPPEDREEGDDPSPEEEAAESPDEPSESPEIASEEPEEAPSGVGPGGEVPDFSALDLGFQEEEEESQWARTLARTSWGRMAGLMLVLTLASVAFFTKWVPLRWAALGVTLVYLGWVDGGFLSVSHITSAIGVGPGVFINDLALLLMVVFTLVTTALWGRVFCGYLCPFGALQDILDRMVPRRFQRTVPEGIHRRAIWLKYLILALVLAPAVAVALAPAWAVAPPSLYQYFEPFGTVFFLSPSPLLWVIALAFLASAAVVPRFYCRYACPLGAALAVGARISPFRIARVEQCQVCKVCEQSCPTGAIRGPEVDFPECVRCSVCEVKLREKAGACRHGAELVRSRLVKLRIPAREVSS